MGGDGVGGISGVAFESLPVVGAGWSSGVRALEGWSWAGSGVLEPRWSFVVPEPGGFVLRRSFCQLGAR
jgi:hypothetical protein